MTFLRSLLFLVAALPAVSHAAQFVLFDVTFNYTKADADNAKPNPSHFYVIGNVRTPGMQSLLPQLTLLQAVALCGGFSEFADRHNIRGIVLSWAAPEHATYFHRNNRPKEEVVRVLQDMGYTVN